MASFPAWVICVIVIAVIMATLSGAYYIFRKRISKKKSTVDTNELVQNDNNKDEKDSDLYNHDIEANADKTKQRSANLTQLTRSLTRPDSVHLHQPCLLQELKETIDNTTRMTPIASSPLYHHTKIQDNSIRTIKINLPLPPPCSSFFSDKVELNSDEANYLFQAYSQYNTSLSHPEEKHSVSSAAANIQQKAATIRSTLRQSLGRKKSSALKSMQSLPSDNLVSRQHSQVSFHAPANRTSIQLVPSTTLDCFVSTPQPVYFSKDHKIDYDLNDPAQMYENQYEEVVSNKTMIDDIPSVDYYSAVSTPSFSFQPHHDLIGIDLQNDFFQTENPTLSSDAFNDEYEECKELTTLQEAASTAAKKIICTASRKSRTRSAFVSDRNQSVLDESTLQNFFSTDRKTTECATLRETRRRTSYLSSTNLLLPFSTVGRAESRHTASNYSVPITVSWKKDSQNQELQRMFRRSNNSINHNFNNSTIKSQHLRNKMDSSKGHEPLQSLFGLSGDNSSPDELLLTQSDGLRHEMSMLSQSIKQKEAFATYTKSSTYSTTATSGQDTSAVS